MLTVDEALQLVLGHARPKPPTAVNLSAALGLVLAEDVTSDVDSPSHDKALVDGYAIVAADLAGGAAELEVVEEIAAGAVPARPIHSGQATRIMTGAPIPPGADAVVMVEQTESIRSAGSPLGGVRIGSARVTAGDNIMLRGASLRRGQVALSTGCEIRPIEIGVLAEVGHSQVRVIDRPTVAVMPTGNELVGADEVPEAGQIRNSNGPMLIAAAQRAGATAINLGIGRDDENHLRTLIAAGLTYDVLIVSGGVSAGVLDLVPSVLHQFDVEQVFHKIRLKPGKPLWFGVLGGEDENVDKLVFGLPGNPVSSLVCFELFVRPAIARLAGRAATGMTRAMAHLTADHLHRGDRPTYHPGRLRHIDTRILVEPLAWQGSGDLHTLVLATALIHFPAGDRMYRADEMVETLLL